MLLIPIVLALTAIFAFGLVYAGIGILIKVLPVLLIIAVVVGVILIVLSLLKIVVW